MAVAIRMPDFGTAVDEIRLLEWLVAEGEPVARGTLLAQIETDKASTELESAAEGVILKLLAPAGAVARSGDLLAYVGSPGEALPEETPAAPPVERAPAPPETAPALPVVPLALRNLARKLGVDLAAVKPTGTRGEITRQDILLAAGHQPAPAAAGTELSRAQAAVARVVLASHQEVPHLRVAVSVDMTSAEAIRDRAGSGYDALLLKAMATALEAVPLLRAHLEGSRIVTPPGIHLSLAVGFGNQLLLPVIRDVGTKPLAALQREVAGVVAGTRAGSLRPEDFSGACMTLSNLGMYAIDWFEAIIFPGQSAILAAGAVHPQAVVRDGAVVVRPILNVNLAADHRLINGRTAAEFLQHFKQILEAGTLA